MSEVKLNEPLLEDAYPVFAGYWYVVNGKPIQSNVSGTVLTLKADFERYEGVVNPEVRRCDAVKRKLPTC